MDSLEQTVVDLLVAQGLYQDEAQAMFETWRDSWFEEGSRLLYLVPRSLVDSILPLTIQPAPAQTVRVFVGRLELVTPNTQRAIEQAIQTRDTHTLNLYSRFLTPILQNMLATESDPAKKAQLTCYLNGSCAAEISQSSSRSLAFKANQLAALPNYRLALLCPELAGPKTACCAHVRILTDLTILPFRATLSRESGFPVRSLSRRPDWSSFFLRFRADLLTNSRPFAI